MLSSSSWREALRAACIITTVLDYEGVMLASEGTRAVDAETNVNEFLREFSFFSHFRMPTLRRHVFYKTISRIWTFYACSASFKTYSNRQDGLGLWKRRVLQSP